jgi:hypothetical protein
MDKKKLVILILVVIALFAVMTISGGAYRDSQEGGGRPRNDYNGDDSDWEVKLIDGATGWMRSKFDIDRLSGCGRNSRVMSFTGTCEVTIGPGSARPSRFKLVRGSGTVLLCFALSRDKLANCVAGNGEPQMRALEDPAGFTVAKDSAFLFLSCNPGAGATPCVVNVPEDD